MKKSDKAGKLTHSIAWNIGIVLSFLLNYSGICLLFRFVRKTILKKRIAIVLTYHRVGLDSVDHMTVLQTTLDGHLEYLKDNFSVITLAEIVEHYISRKWPDSDVVAITFDDGYRDNLTLAAPILNKYGLPATVFVTSGWIGSPDMLSNAEILELQSRNVAIGAHTVSHPRLADISRNNIEIELKESKANLQGILNKEVCVMAYPKGKQGDVGTVAVELARAAGYQAAFSTENGLVNEAADIHFLPRLGIREVPLFVFKVRVSGIFESPTIRRSRKTMGLT